MEQPILNEHNKAEYPPMATTTNASVLERTSPRLRKSGSSESPAAVGRTECSALYSGWRRRKIIKKHNNKA